MSVYFTITHIVPAYTESLGGCLVNYVHVRFLLKARLIRPSYCRDMCMKAETVKDKGCMPIKFLCL